MVDELVRVMWVVESVGVGHWVGDVGSVGC